MDENTERHSETAVLAMSDLHYGKRTPTFTPEIFQERLARVGQRIDRIRTRYLRNTDISDLRIACGGDASDGSEIYKTQTHHQAISNVERQGWELSDILATWAKERRKAWKEVSFDLVPGNHGAGFAAQRMHESANWDLVCYRYLALKCGKKIPVRFDPEDPFIRKINVRGHDFVLYHGDSIRSYGSIPWYGMLLRTSKWLSTKIAPFELVIMGHFHSFGLWKVNEIQIMATGTMVTDDEWALRTLGWESACVWWLFGVSEKRAIAWSYPIYLDEEE